MYLVCAHVLPPSDPMTNCLCLSYAAQYLIPFGKPADIDDGWLRYILVSCQDSPPSHEEKGSGDTTPNPLPSYRNVKRPIKLQSGIYWNNAEVRTSTSIIPLKLMINASILPQVQGFGLVKPEPSPRVS